MAALAPRPWGVGRGVDRSAEGAVGAVADVRKGAAVFSGQMKSSWAPSVFSMKSLALMMASTYS
jgi:hypothetical protein